MPEIHCSSRRQLLSSLAAVAMLSACAPLVPRVPGGPQRSADRIDADLSEVRYLLLGEVHDNAQGHALRLDLLTRLTSSGRWTIALEQFDASRQAALDVARAEASTAARSDAGSVARQLAESAGFDFDGWEWAHYLPVIELALGRELPLIAANLSRAEASARVRGEVEAADDPRPRGWTDVAERSMSSEIRDGHCGLLPEWAIARMVGAQIARDRTMARALVDAHRRTGMPVILLAGNGHIRTDIGVPVHLVEMDPGAAIASVWIGEGQPPMGASRDATAATDTAAPWPFDRRYEVPPAPRPDPCELLRKPRAIR